MGPETRRESSSQAHEEAVRHSQEYWAERERRQAAGDVAPPQGSEASPGAAQRDQAEMLDLLRMAGHDLQAPLKVLKLNVEFLTDERSSPELRARSKRIIKRVASRLEFLLQDILEMAETDRADFVLHRTNFDLTELVKQSTETYGLLAEEMGMAVDVDAEAELPVEGDKMRLAQVCMNVITEAIWTAPRGSRLQVQAIRDGKVARIEVSTSPGRRTGSLRPLDEMALEPDHKQGLGFHLAHAILDQHGGSFKVRRGPGGQSNTFTVRVPLTDA